MRILITGSSSGIGKAIAEMCLANTYQVIGLVRDASKFCPNHHHYQHFQINFTKIATLEGKLKAIQKTIGPVDALICCHGFGQFNELEQFSVHQMQQLMDVNFLSQAILIKTFLPQLKKQQSGKIIVIGSECALQGAKKASIYAASKFALRGFCQSLRQECQSANVAVSMVNPGLVNTPFFNQLDFKPGGGKANVISPEQIAAAVNLLLGLENNCVVEELNLQPMKSQVVRTKSQDFKQIVPCMNV